MPKKNRHRLSHSIFEHISVGVSWLFFILSNSSYFCRSIFASIYLISFNVGLCWPKFSKQNVRIIFQLSFMLMLFKKTRSNEWMNDLMMTFHFRTGCTTGSTLCVPLHQSEPCNSSERLHLCVGLKMWYYHGLRRKFVFFFEVLSIYAMFILPMYFSASCALFLYVSVYKSNCSHSQRRRRKSRNK